MGVYYLGAFPAQSLHVTTVRPPTQEMWSGSKSMLELELELELAIAIDLSGV